MAGKAVWKMTPKEFKERYGLGFSGREAMKTVGGLVAMAGVDPESLVLSRRIKDHPMLGRRAKVYIWFAGEEPVVLAEGKVDRVLTHPGGQLLFDLVIDKPEVYETVRLWPDELHAGIVAYALSQGKDVSDRAKRGYPMRLGRWMPSPEIVQELLGVF